MTNDNVDNLSKLDNIDIIIWAHGCNINDNIKNYNSKDCIEIINGNVIFILNTLNKLLKLNKINNNCKMVIISSIWEEFTRDNKL